MNPEYWALESGIQLKESGIPLNDWSLESKFHWQRMGIQYWESEIHDVESRIHDCRGFHYMGRLAYFIHAGNALNSIYLGSPIFTGSTQRRITRIAAGA